MLLLWRLGETHHRPGGPPAGGGGSPLAYRGRPPPWGAGGLLSGGPAVADVERDMAETMSKCRRLTVEDCKRDKLSRRAMGWLLRPLGPLM